MNPSDHSQPLNDVKAARGLLVYVVTANEEEKVKEQQVFASLFEAEEFFVSLKPVYGGANVCLMSRWVR
jgi:hypothetical protein